MKSYEINISLDPINDGMNYVTDEISQRGEGSLIIATNGDSRIADLTETTMLAIELIPFCEFEKLGNSDYIAVLNRNKIINYGTGKCFVGTALVAKWIDGGFRNLVDDDYEKAEKAFRSHLIRMVCDGKEFPALEIGFTEV